MLNSALLTSSKLLPLQQGACEWLWESNAENAEKEGKEREPGVEALCARAQCMYPLCREEKRREGKKEITRGVRRSSRITCSKPPLLLLQQLLRAQGRHGTMKALCAHAQYMYLLCQEKRSKEGDH
eukprot:1156455-Pelagomonas_calceolata.AAC.5